MKYSELAAVTLHFDAYCQHFLLNGFELDIHQVATCNNKPCLGVGHKGSDYNMQLK